MQEDIIRLNNLLSRGDFQDLPEIIRLIERIIEMKTQEGSLKSGQKMVNSKRVIIPIIKSDKWEKDRKFHFKSVYVEMSEIEEYIERYNDGETIESVKLFIEYILKSIYLELEDVAQQLTS